MIFRSRTASTERVSSRLSELPRSCEISNSACTSWRAAAMEVRKSTGVFGAWRSLALTGTDSKPAAGRVAAVDFDIGRELGELRIGALGLRHLFELDVALARALRLPVDRRPCRIPRARFSWPHRAAARGDTAGRWPARPGNRPRPGCARRSESLRRRGRPDSRCRPIFRDARARWEPPGRGT